jgi:hypothetical protein
VAAAAASRARLRSLGERAPAVTVERVVVLTRHGDRTPAACVAVHLNRESTSRPA